MPSTCLVYSHMLKLCCIHLVMNRSRTLSFSHHPHIHRNVARMVVDANPVFLFQSMATVPPNDMKSKAASAHQFCQV